jgi:hypothetical protein
LTSFSCWLTDLITFQKSSLGAPPPLFNARRKEEVRESPGPGRNKKNEIRKFKNPAVSQSQMKEVEEHLPLASILSSSREILASHTRPKKQKEEPLSSNPRSESPIGTRINFCPQPITSIADDFAPLLRKYIPHRPDNDQVEAFSRFLAATMKPTYWNLLTKSKSSCKGRKINKNVDGDFFSI